MAGMSMKEIARIVEHVEPQGVTVTRTKKGLLLRLPNQETTMVHFTTSDVRAHANLRATLKRSGVSMPTDKHHAATELPAYITGTKPTARSLDRAQASLTKLGLRKVTTKQLVDAGGAPNVIQAAQVLYALGWLPDRTKKHTKRYWVAPVDTDTEPTFATIHPIRPDAASEPQVAPEVPEAVVVAPEAPSGPAPREFLDTVDSWAAWEDLPADMTLGQARAMLAALGLSAELRVWRA